MFPVFSVFRESTNNNITFLRLSIVNATLTGDLSSFMSKFHDHVPSLETVELSIHVDQSFVSLTWPSKSLFFKPNLVGAT